MKIEALIRILQYCEDNNIDIDYGTKENISSVKRCAAVYVGETDKFFTKGKLYIGTVKGKEIEIEEDNEGDLHWRHISEFSIIKEF